VVDKGSACPISECDFVALRYEMGTFLLKNKRNFIFLKIFPLTVT